MRQIEDLENIADIILPLGYDVLFTRGIELASKDGLFLEFGVAGGGSINRIAKQIYPKKIHGFDSFKGLPETWNGNKEGTFVCGIPNVSENVVLHIGMFEETLPTFVLNYPQNISFLNIDCDIYSSTKTIFKYLGNRIVPGTIIRFDELMGYPEWRDHEYKAFMEFLIDFNLDCDIIGRSDSERFLVRIK